MTRIILALCVVLVAAVVVWWSERSFERSLAREGFYQGRGKFRVLVK